MSGEGWGGATRLGSEPLAGEPFGEWLDASGRRGRRDAGETWRQVEGG